jgi:Sulfotransferase family
LSDALEEPQRFFFVHMQKTAGTTLTRRLRNCFGETAMCPNDVERAGNPMRAAFDVEHLQAAFASRRDEIRVVTGHYPHCVSEMLGVPFTTFTVLRDPVERTLSVLRQARSKNPERSFEELYADPFRLHTLIVNHMVRMLSATPDDMPGGRVTYVDFGERHLENAKRTLADRVDAFGLQEEFDRFCAELEGRYGWDLGPPQHALRTEPQAVTEELRERIARDSHLDVQLYAYAQELWRERHPTS